MYQDDDDSIASSFEEEDQMEIFIDRCSICFDAQHNLCVESCRDQFCLECFIKYIAQVVKSSWGLSVTTIKCPVCNEVISKQEWSRYVPRSIVELYDKYNAPYKSYTRACIHCEIEIVPCVHQPTVTNLHQQSSIICDFLNIMLSSCPKQEQHIADKDHRAIYDWIRLFSEQKINETKLMRVHKQLIKDIFQFERSHITHYSTSKKYQHHYSYQISLLLLKAATNPDVWKQLQFNHISFFPNMNCSNCQSSICLHCGYDSHQSLTCEENMKHLVINTNLNNEIKNTIVWKLENSRQCPNCSIMINRDEGCNKVDCSYCGHSFCWCCRSSWSDGCGFYRCSTITTITDYNSTRSDYNSSTNNRTEIGVPDMKNIQERIYPDRQSSISFN